MKKNQRLLLFLFLLFSVSVNAQQRTITGHVRKDNNEPVANATVAVRNTTTATQTDSAGYFSLSVPASATTLIISYVGFKNEEVSIGSRTDIAITLTPSSATLQDVVVTALGFETKKEKLGYATSKVDGAQVANSGEVGLTDALGGKASGVKVSRTSGSDPGASSQILIRGQSTITRSTDPLIVLDGVPINGSSRDQGGGGTTTGSRLNDINPDDIATIQVLKGASAAALWGTQAANGVLMITTKKGSGQKTAVNVSSTYSLDQVNMKYPMQTTYGQGLNGKWTLNAPRSWGDKIADRSGAADVLDMNGPYFQAYNNGQKYYNVTQKNSKQTFVDQNWDEVFHNGHYWDNNVSVSGADAKSNYFFSVGNIDQKGVIRSNSDYQRTSIRLNASRKIAPWLTVSNKGTYALTNSNRIQRGVNTSGFTTAILRTSPDFDNAGYIGDYFSSPTGSAVPNRQRSYRNAVGSAADPGFNNPQWDIYQLTNKDKVNRFINSAELNAQPVSWLNLIARAGIDYMEEEVKNFWPVNTATATGGSYSRSEYKQTLFNVDVIARAEKNFSDAFTGNLLVGFNYNSNANTNLSGSALNFIIPGGPQSLNNFPAANIGADDSYYLSKTNAGYASAGVGLFDQLFVNGTFRAEAASTFGSSNSRFFYPSTDVAWIFTKMKLFGDNSVLSFGKLRGSFGIVGIQPAPYQTSNLFVSPTWNDQLLSSLTAGLYGNGTYVQSSNKGNPQLKPERKQEFEVGTDLRFFQDKLILGLTYYQNKTIDALLSIPLAVSTGFSSVYANAGSIQNKGFEADLSYNIFRNKDWNVNIDVNWSKNDNKVTNLNGVNSFSLAGSGVAGASAAIQGYPLGELYGIGWQRDSKGTLILDANGFPKADVVSKPLGNPNPDWRGAAGIKIAYKNLSLYALVEHSHGGVIMDATEAVLLDYGTSATTGREQTAGTAMKTLSGATIAAGTKFRGNIQNFGGGPVALEQSWYTGIGGWFGNVYEQFIHGNTWTRFRELTLAYNVKSVSRLTKGTISSVVVELSGRNLLLFSSLKGIDPDTNLNSNSSGRGVTYFDNPGTRSYLASLKLNF
ncbi:MAG: SusC/RagA family TonB-linked outer membrane protein [Bacteroidetes bacterium]|nr:SusC/RagA family TonB-linked outer membrane protein [Bacteroidota bacterium]